MPSLRILAGEILYPKVSPFRDFSNAARSSVADNNVPVPFAVPDGRVDGGVIKAVTLLLSRAVFARPAAPIVNRELRDVPNVSGISI